MSLSLPLVLALLPANVANVNEPEGTTARARIMNYYYQCLAPKH
jgi:hypothetical protein